MSPWLVQHFLNSAFFWPGVALISAPIIIHLIHRLRYRRVRFAAMEFLLASEKRNRRRILFEQLLLLLLRIAMILLIVFLIARLVIDPSEISLFQGAKAHHVVILDDSLSMRDRIGNGSAYDEAKKLLRRVIAEGAQRPGTQKLTLIRATRPNESVSGMSEQDIDDRLLIDATDRLDAMTCSHQHADLAEALQAAISRLKQDRAAAKYLHVLSDFRNRDWTDNAAAATALRQLTSDGVTINLVRCTPSTHENLGILSLSGSVEVAAAGVPVSFTAKVKNWGTRAAEAVRAQILVDGERLPRTLGFGTVDPGDEGMSTFEITFDKPGMHRVRLILEEDALSDDNERFLAVNVPVENPVLIVDGSPSADQALYLADALAADQAVTGFAPEIRKPDDLRKLQLDRYHLVYLVDVGDLAADALEALRQYVSAGGGLVWYVGDAVRPGYYNTELFAKGNGLFPAWLATAPAKLPRADDVALSDIVIGEHPMFQVLAGEENPFIDAVFVNRYYPLGEPPEGQRKMARDAQVLAKLRNGAPLVLEHNFGKGRIVTCLTSAGPLVDPEGTVWTNWANGPGKISFVVVQLEIARHVARRDRALPFRTVGAPIVEELPRAYYRDEIQFVTPDDQVTRTKAVAEESTPPGTSGQAPLTISAVFRDTDLPGIYGVVRLTHDQRPEQHLIAYNVPAEEGALAVADDQQLLRQLGENAEFTIQPFGRLDWIRSESPGSEMRWLILVAFCLVGMLEQWLANKFSYHLETAS